jgi:hypothetical protein
MKNTVKNAESILEDMRRITMLTGEISSVHEKSLLTWPYVMFNNIENVEIKYDLSKSGHLEFGHNSIDFFITLSEENKKNIDNFEKRCETLKQWAESMLWSGIKVKVYMNDSLEYLTNSDK